MNTFIARAAAALAMALATSIVAAGPTYAAGASEDDFGHALASGDFNGDGLDDLAVGAPLREVSEARDAGLVRVHYGSINGIRRRGQTWHANNDGAAGDRAESGDRYGMALTAGDFDNDGFSDLAIGSPAQDIGADAAAGAVVVIYGSALGLTSARSQFWHQDNDGSGSAAEAGDWHGSTLASGDFDGDGADELAIGARLEDWGTITDSGLVTVLAGSDQGLTATGAQIWHQGNDAISGVNESGDEYGLALAAANFGRGAQEDLAIGAPLEDVGVGNDAEAGAVFVQYGTRQGIGAQGDLWHQDSDGITGATDVGDHYGWSLAAANLGGDARADLAIGAPDEDLGGETDAGAVFVHYGSHGGLTDGGDLWHQGNDSPNSTLEGGDRFGYSLAAANFGNGGRHDLAIGTPGKALSFDEHDAGAVVVLYGAADGLTANGADFWHQDASGMPDFAERGDRFGQALSGGNYGEQRQADLAIGAPWEDYEAVDDGVVAVKYGSPTGLTGTADLLSMP